MKRRGDLPQNASIPGSYVFALPIKVIGSNLRKVSLTRTGEPRILLHPSLSSMASVYDSPPDAVVVPGPLCIPRQCKYSKTPVVLLGCSKGLGISYFLA